MSDQPFIVAITACPTGIAHTYMAAEKLEEAAGQLGYRLAVETHGSIGVENAFTAVDIAAADAVLIAADTVISTERFAGKKLLVTGVDVAIADAAATLRRALDAPVAKGRGEGEVASGGSSDPDARAGGTGGLGTIGATMYRALMNGVSHMVPFVVTGGLLLAVALSVGGQAGPDGLVIPDDSFWKTIEQIGNLAFSLMVPVLSAYIAVGIADRPGLAPGFVTGLIAVNGALYHSEANAGFIGGIITGILSGYVALAIRKIPVNKFVAPIWPIIVIPILTTLLVGLLFVYVIGHPVAALFEALTQALDGMSGGSVIVLGAVLGAMIAFDMGGPFNKTAFLFGGGLIAAGNAHPMGMAAAAIAVPPLAVGVATLIKRREFTKPERDAGIAALFMGCFGITEGAIPLAAARPLQVIPANVVGGAVAGALAGWWGVADNVMHGGPIVAVLGAVEGVPWFFLALACGIAVTAGLLVALVHEPKPEDAAPAPALTPEATSEAPGASLPLYDATTVRLDEITAEDRAGVIEALAASLGPRLSDAPAVVAAALDREAQNTTAVGEGVAIPHARCVGVEIPTLAMARLPEPGVEWGAADGTPVRLVLFIAVPEGAGNRHLKILAALARALARDLLRERLLAARTPEDAVAALDNAVGESTEAPAASGR